MEPRWRNVPNALSFLRLALVPVLVWLFFSGAALYWAGGVYLFAGATDVLDGYLARRNGQVTRLGRIIDPLADKLMQLAAFACLAVRGFIPGWAILILAAREFIILLGGYIMLRRTRDVLPSNKFGKAASALFYVVTIAVIVFDMPQTLRITLLSGALLFSIAALLIYYRQARLLRAGPGKR